MFPIRKVKDDFEVISSEENNFDNILNLFDYDSLLSFSNTNNEKEKEIMNQIWSTSKEIDNGKFKISSSISLSDLNLLKNRGKIVLNGDEVKLTSSGKKLLRECLLDEESTFTKKASKKIVSKNSYDFGENVLVKVNHPEKFGARYVSVNKKSFTRKNIEPQKIEAYTIQTKNENGDYKKLSEYSDEELIQALHLSKKIIANASALSLKEGIRAIPVHRIKSFSELIMTELNSR